MASNKLTDLIPITADQLSGADPFYVVDVSVNQSKKILLSELFLWADRRINAQAPFNITATPGNQVAYATEDTNIIYLTWVGGSGTFDLILPSATDTPYRKIQIISDGTLSANDKVHVLAPVGERIDGAINPGFYTLNKPFNGVTVWSDGTQWIVTQAKSS